MRRVPVAMKMRPLQVRQWSDCSSLAASFSRDAGGEAAAAKLVRAAQHSQATPMLVLETMSCLWSIMFVSKVGVTRR